MDGDGWKIGGGRIANLGSTRQPQHHGSAALDQTLAPPPDDGSPDPFLIDPAQKAEATPVEFPAKRR